MSTMARALLLRELPGYAGYCARVRYRLIPGLWQARAGLPWSARQVLV